MKPCRPTCTSTVWGGLAVTAFREKKGEGEGDPSSSISRRKEGGTISYLHRKRGGEGKQQQKRRTRTENSSKNAVSKVFLLFLKNTLFQIILFFTLTKIVFFPRRFFSPRPCCSVSGTAGRREEKGWKEGRGKVFRPPPALPPPAFSDGRKRERGRVGQEEETEL